MKTISGRFIAHNGRPAANGTLHLTLSRDARVIATGENVTGRYHGYTKFNQCDPIVIELNERGEIPEGTEVWGNDELSPDTDYDVSGHLNDEDQTEFCSQSDLKITGPSPVDLAALVASQEVKAFVPVPKPPRVLPQPSERKRGFSYHGFFGGSVIQPIASDLPCKPVRMSGKDGLFAVYGFLLPYKAIVGAISVYIEEPAISGNVHVGLYNGSGDKLCAAAINATKIGLSTTELDHPQEILAGDLFLVWGADEDCVRVRGMAVGAVDMVNGGGGATLAGVVRSAGRELPEKLGPISLPSSFGPNPVQVPILSFFRA